MTQIRYDSNGMEKGLNIEKDNESVSKPDIKKGKRRRYERGYFEIERRILARHPLKLVLTHPER